MSHQRNAKHPAKFLVLLATHNGAQWLSEQLSSLYNQTGVQIKVVARDDQSSDETRSILDLWSRTRSLEVMAPDSRRHGNANRNFFSMIRDVSIGDAEYIALADQDDVWHPEKLELALTKINHSMASAYSSNVEAFWPNGKKCLIKKSQPQKALDHLFSSPGPGCTFVFSRKFFLELQAWVQQRFEEVSQMWVHDWVIYAYARSMGHVWAIDDYVSMQYRQHANNEIGANFGVSALMRRLMRVRDGDYRNDILSICKLVNAPAKLIQALERFSLQDRFWLMLHAFEFRREAKESLVLIALFFLMPNEK
jgi:rhamnosyltransferase